MPGFRFMHVPVVLLLVVSTSDAGPQSDFTPDPASVQRHGPAYRYPQAGWVVLHIEGEPYERGYQHGRLLSHEIAEYVKALATSRSPKAPAEGWRDARLLVNALFQRRYEKEFLEEMKGIADGAAAAGAKFEGKTLDFLDVVTINSSIELDFLQANLDATATGLEGIKFREPPYARKGYRPPPHCSAFAATGPATADGKIVFGHITMFDLYHVRHFNVWLDIKPTKGRRVGMQSFPGGIMSGMDSYLNDAGLLVCETTIGQTKFDINGSSMVSRIRQAVQYAEGIDEFVRIMTKDNNGVYTNEWLLGDTKTNEIAMFELGTHKHRLWRSSKNEWYGDTPGFYWGCNNSKDLQVRLETLPGVHGKPANVVFAPSPRDRMWLRLYDKHKGKIGTAFGFEAFTTPPIAAFPSCDAKFTTTAMAREMKTWALFGPPLGRTWEASEEERNRTPDIRPLVSNDWTMLNVRSPAEKDVVKAVDLNPSAKKETQDSKDDLAHPGKLPAAWHGTLLPKGDADIWLAGAFAEYEKIVALEKALKERAKDGKLDEADRERLALAVFAQRSRWRTAVVRLGKDVPLSETKRELRRADWYDIAVGKGVLVLAALRRQMGAEAFEKAMDEFGRANAGKEVTAEQFVAFLKKASGKQLLSADPEPGDNPCWSVYSFAAEPEDVLIVYGTRKEKHAQREAAELLQKALLRLRAGGISNFTVPIKADTEVTEEELKSRHLLLIGRPDTNTLLERSAQDLPVRFGPASFTLRGKTYANPASAVIAAGANALNARYSVVVFAGLGTEATRRSVQNLSGLWGNAATPVVLLKAGEAPRPVIPGAPEPAASR